MTTLVLILSCLVEKSLFVEPLIKITLEEQKFKYVLNE